MRVRMTPDAVSRLRTVQNLLPSTPKKTPSVQKKTQTHTHSKALVCVLASLVINYICFFDALVWPNHNSLHLRCTFTALAVLRTPPPPDTHTHTHTYPTPLHTGNLYQVLSFNNVLQRIRRAQTGQPPSQKANEAAFVACSA
jgi:hypothetical protein